MGALPGAIKRFASRLRVAAGSPVIAFSLLCSAAILGNLAFQLLQSRSDALKSAARSATAMVRVLEKQTSATLDAADLALRSAERAALAAQGSNADVDGTLRDHLASLPFVRALFVLDADGNMIHDSERLPGAYNLAERAYFQAHRAADAGLYIDQPFVSKHGVSTIALSRRINRPDGSFGGVAVAALEPQALRKFYEAIKLGRDGVVTLARKDGVLMLRVPEAGTDTRPAPLTRLIAESAARSEGSYLARSTIDGIERQFHFRHVERQPLVLVLGVSTDETLASWRRASIAYVAVSLGFLLLVLWLSRLTFKELKARHALNQALEESGRELRAAQRLAKIGSWRLEYDTGREYWSEEMYRVMGLEPAATPPSMAQFNAMLHPDDVPEIYHGDPTVQEWSQELRSNPALGPIRYFHSRASLVKGADGRPTALLGTLQDITEQRLAQDKLRLSARVFEHTGDGIVVTDAANMIVAVNAAFERIMGYTEAEVLGQSALMLHADVDNSALAGTLWHSLQNQGQWRGEIRSRRKNGQLFPQWLNMSAISSERGEVEGYVGVFSDLSAIRSATEQLQFMNNHDPLTRLPNRSLLNDRLQQAIDGAGPEQRQLAVLLMNVDRLKRINEGIGHDAGDLLLREIGERLRTRIEPGDTLARLGSDEFVLLMTHLDDLDDVNACAQQLLELVAQPVHALGHELTVTASIGIALYPGDGTTPVDLIKNADTALAHVKESGRNSFRYYTGQMNIRALHWMSLEHRLRGAQARGELALHYQPQMDLASGHLCGMEALIRWNNETLGNVSPAEFIPLAEDTGLIVQIGEWVIRTACAQSRAWRDAGLAPVPIAVNVSGHQIMLGNVPALIADALAVNGLEPSALGIELTESVLMSEADTAMRQIDQLRAMGITVALDDFGTGYSSLSYLSRFALDKIKIDQCLVRHITDDVKSLAIARATIGLAHGLGLTVVAEGVETQEQLALLRDEHCDDIQGYLYSRPVAGEAAATFLARAATPRT
ncbi:EAL domain-containing protein [Massilia sp. PAMC28688]|uniref:bifunctional diguanylate cyclase/phosphodiesterase n=1 Tax=Massilia sp. PAMC28688 TaxID=2861283 RepID=UPI001C63B6B8|nr:EAL domain-containing protein [Massilia sp. PAMC28688]QYF93792.1 EAL domain-containing protein [Massilia sp. PAMC28688]